MTIAGNQGQNLYPAPDNYPASSFPQPVPVPDGEPDDAGTLISVQYSWLWREVLMAAVDQLRNPATWEGDHDAIILALNRATNLKDLLQKPVSVSSAVAAPFWDASDGSDADDESDPDTQEWYGVWDGETFVEALSYWAVTAFLATGISEGAAIQFITPLRTFRLKLKADPHGAKLLILMDSNIFQLVDLFSPTEEVREVVVVSPGSTLMLVHAGEHNPSATPDANGNYPVYVIKSELSETDVQPANVRVNPDTNAFQTTADGGVTWVDSPQSDPRTNEAGMLPPLTPYSGLECDVAARMTAQLRETLQAFLDFGDAAQAAMQVIQIILPYLAEIGWLVSLLIDIAQTLIDNGQATIAAAFTEAVWDDIRCILSCFVQADGRIDQPSLDVAYDQISAAHPGVVATTIAELRLFYGDVIMVNAGVLRTETGDCSGCASCSWVVEYDFTQGSTDHWIIDYNPPNSYGTFTGDMFQAIKTVSPSLVQLVIMLFEAGLQVTDAAVLVEQFHGTGVGNNVSVYDVTVAANPPTFGANKALAAIVNTSPAAWITIGITDFTTTAGLLLYWLCDGNGTGYVKLQKIRLKGTGTPPATGKRVASLTP